jgi:Ca-activated chloride channel family protein
MNGLEFRDPSMVLFAILVPIVFVLARRSQGQIIFSALHIIPSVRTLRTRLVWVPAFLLSVAALLLIFAAMGPRVGNRDSEVKKEGIAIMMAMDTSGSMQALDLDQNEDDTEQNRLDVVKVVFEEFVLGNGDLSGRRNDSIGLIRFAGFADTACPLTLDHGNLVGVAKGVDIVTEQTEDGTAIGDGLALAVSRIKKSPARSKVIILLTDGVNNSGVESPLAAAELARTEGVKVYTIGAGTNGLAPVRVADPFSGRSVLRSMPVQIDEETLKKIAEISGGLYFRATDYDRLKEVYATIDRLEKTELKQVLFRQYTEYFRHLVGFGLLFALLGIFLDATYFRRTP